MPVLDIGGTRVSVDDGFLKLPPDQQNATVEEIAKSLPKQAADAPQIGIGEDLGNAAKAAPGRAVASLLGLPGDLYHLGLRALGDNLTPRSDYGSEAIRQSLGSDYQAQRLPGQLLEKTADFAPAMIGGPESLALKAATRVAVPVIGSQVGKEVAGPYGEVAGALLFAGGASAAARKFQQMAAARGAVDAAPAAEDILKAARGQFKAAEDMNVVLKPDFTTNAAADMRASLRGFDPEGQAPVFKAVDRLENLGASAPGMPPTAIAMNDVELIRKQLTNLKMSPDPATREAARKALTSLVDSQKGLVAADVVAGDAALYSKTMQDAVGNYAAGKRSNTVMGKAALGDLNAATAGSGANEDNALRQAIKQLVRPVNNDIVPKAQRLGFNQAEIDAMNKVARGTSIGNTARYIGKLAPTGSVSGALGAGAGYGVGGPVGAIALPAAGYLAKKIGDMSTKSAIKTLDSLVRSRSPLAQQVAAQLPPHVVAQLPAKTQGVLQTLATQPIAQQQAPRSMPTPAPQPLPPQRPLTAPPAAAPIFAKPAPVQSPPAPQLTAAGDGQPPRPSRLGLGENIRSSKYQDWEPGRVVKVGFVDGLKVEGSVPATYPGDPAGFVLTKGDKVYIVTPHRGMQKLSAAEGKQALADARQAKGN